MKVQVTEVKVPGNDILGTKETSMYYAIVENNIGKKMKINIGKKTHDEIQMLIETENKEPEKKGGKA